VQRGGCGWSTGGGEMEFVEKARVRLNHWLAHNDSHRQEYEEFAAELETAGQTASALRIREMVTLSAKSGECLRKALQSLER
jgi:hypothetical protein